MPFRIFGPELAGQLVAGDVGLDQARGHRVDADVVRAELAGHRLGEAEHAGLGGAVVRPAEDAAAALRRDRRHADDRARLLLLHGRDRRLAHVERAAQVHVEDGVVVLRADAEELDRLGDAGVVDQHVDPAELGHHLLDRRLAGRLVGDVAGIAAMRVAEFGGRSRRGASPSRSRMIARPPCSAKSRAVARPMPRCEAAPVTMQILSARSIAAFPL